MKNFVELTTPQIKISINVNHIVTIYSFFDEKKGINCAVGVIDIKESIMVKETYNEVLELIENTFKV